MLELAAEMPILSPASLPLPLSAVSGLANQSALRSVILGMGCLSGLPITPLTPATYDPQTAEPEGPENA